MLPYGFVVDSGKSSRMGTDFGLPYTVAEELKTNRFTLYFFIVSHKSNVPVILL